MTYTLQGKTIALGVTGSIACYKAVDLASKLVQMNADVDALMTDCGAPVPNSSHFRRDYASSGRHVHVRPSIRVEHQSRRGR